MSQVLLCPVADAPVEISSGFWFHMRAGARVIRIFVSNEALPDLGQQCLARRERFASCREYFESTAMARYAAGRVDPDGIIRL